MATARERTVFLHIGLGKTGTTYLQHYFQFNRLMLRQCGLVYPDAQDSFSGNGHLLTQSFLQYKTNPELITNLDLCADCYFFSREHFARELSDPVHCEQFIDFLHCLGFSRIHVMLFVRNPTDHCYSLWAQKVKARDEVRSLRSFSSGYDSLRIATKCLHNLLSLRCNVKVLNYTLVSSDILAHMHEWLVLGCPNDTSKNLSLLFGAVGLGNIAHESMNVTPNAALLAIKRLLNRFGLARQGKSLLRIMSWCKGGKLNESHKQLYSSNALSAFQEDIDSFSRSIRQCDLDHEHIRVEL